MPEVKRCTVALGDKSLTYEFIGKGLVRYSIGEISQSLHHGFFEALILRHKSELKGDVFPLKLSQGMHKSRSLMRVVFAVFPDSANKLFDHTSVLDDSAWFDPIRAKPSRFYQVSGRHEFSACGGHTPYLLKEILGRKGSTKRDKSISQMIRLIGVESGLFDDIKISTQGGGKSSPFSVQVTINGIDHYVDQVGYGVSQVLPMIVELLNHGSFDSYYLQQPEVHLHPKAQAGFSNLIYIYATRFPDTLLAIETHSDYVLDRFSVLCREKYLDLKNIPEASIYWHEKSDDGVNMVHKIDLDSNGDLPVELPDGYREFFIKESMRSIGLNVDN